MRLRQWRHLTETRNRQKKAKAGRARAALRKEQQPQQRRAVVSEQHTTITKYNRHNSQKTGQDSAQHGSEVEVQGGRGMMSTKNAHRDIDVVLPDNTTARASSLYQHKIGWH
jgi:hypothetical protein